MIKDYYELRYIETNTIEGGSFSLFDDTQDRRTLLDFISENDKIFLLGNPGVGKTTELKYIFNEFWSKIDTDQCCPFYLNIKTFRTTSKIEDLIKKENWEDLPSMIFIFDGLDEIANIQDFISELENFISRYEHLKIKYILSCRTNIYGKYLIDIPKFKKVYLKYLSSDQIKRIFTKKYHLNVLDSEIENLESILQTPFNLDLFAEYHISNGKLPSTIEESMELFITSEAKKTIEKLNKRSIITESHIISSCGKAAVSAELMQQNLFLESQLYQILGNDGIDIFKELPYVEIQESDFKFRHKNYQEYFAAKYIANLEKEEIITFISADGIKRIKPSLFNTVTFLFNILRDEKFEHLKNWLMEHDIEVLFYADDNRLSPNFQNQIFEKYYHDQCINKTFWLTSNDKIKIDILAKYANFEFILNEIRNKERLERCRISLVEVLSYKNMSNEQLRNVKSLFLELINNENSFFQSEVLRAIKTLKLNENDPEFWKIVFHVVKGSLDGAVSHQLISILSNISETEKNNDDILTIISHHFRLNEDRVIRGTEQLAGNIMLNTKYPIFFLNLIKLFFDDNNTLRIDRIFSLDFKDLLAKKIKQFSEDNDFKVDFFNFCFTNETKLFSQEDFLSTVVSYIGISTDDMLRLLKTEQIQKDSLYVLSRYFTKNSIDAVVTAYIKKELEFINIQNIQSIRNWMSHSNLELALYWQEKFIEIGYKFSEPLLTEEQKREHQKKCEEFKKSNFELLFNKDKLITEIRHFFIHNDVKELEKSKFQKISWEWYNNTGYHALRNTVHVVIELGFRKQKKLDIKTILVFLEDEHFCLSLIKLILSHNSANSYILKKCEKDFLKELTHKLEKKIDYNDVVKFHSTDTSKFSTTINYEYIKVLLFFDRKFNISHNDMFYINILEFGNITGNFGNDDTNFINYISSKINNTEELNNKIIINIKEKKLSYFSKKDHFEYAIKNNLKSSFEEIGQQLIKGENLFNISDLLEVFVDKIDNPLEYLKSCCTNISSYLCWKAIKLIKEKYHDDDFCLEIARKYLNGGSMDFIHKAVNILFYLNQEDSLFFYNILLDKIIAIQQGDSNGYLPKDISNYKQLNELSLIEPLFYKIFNKISERSFYLHHSREFLRIIITNLGHVHGGYDQLKPILLKIKSEIDSKTDQAFYINDLIEILENTYLKENSKELSIDDTLKIVK